MVEERGAKITEIAEVVDRPGESTLHLGSYSSYSRAAFRGEGLGELLPP